MAKKIEIVPLRGPVHWVETNDAVLGQTTGATLQNNKRLVINLTCSDGPYSVVLDREFGDHFTGSWSFREGGRTLTGHASGTLYRAGDNYFIFGRWVEETPQHWWAELSIVKEDTDEE